MSSDRPPDFNVIADDEAKSAFFRPGPECIQLLPAGTKLYKWSKTIVGRTGITPWWFFLEPRILPNGVRCDGLREKQEYANRLSMNDRDYHRVRAAVTMQWNPMTHPIAVQLNNSAWGYIGKAAGQLEDNTISDVFLIGGDYQVWIPGLKAADLTQISVLPYLASRSTHS